MLSLPPQFFQLLSVFPFNEPFLMGHLGKVIWHKEKYFTLINKLVTEKASARFVLNFDVIRGRGEQCCSHLFLIIHSKPGLCHKTLVSFLFLYICCSCYKALLNLIHSQKKKKNPCTATWPGITWILHSVPLATGGRCWKMNVKLLSVLSGFFVLISLLNVWATGFKHCTDVSIIFIIV